MTESIDKTFKYGSYIEDPVLTNSTVETGIGGLLRLYKSRTGQAAKNRPCKIWISKTRYYLISELTSEQLDKVLTYKRKLKEYQAAKAAGRKDLARPIEPRFKNVKPRKINKKSDNKDKAAWNKLATRYESIAANTFNCSGNKVFGEYFITLTNRDKRIRSKAIADAQYNAFIKRFKRWLSSKRTKAGKPFKYSMLTVKEYGKQGYHYHILLKIMLPISEIREVSQGTWKHGFYKVESLKDALKLSRYFFGSSNDRVAMQSDIKGLDKQLQQLEQQQSDLIRLKKKAHKKGLKDMEQSYDDGIKETKETLKQLRRSKVKSDDTIIRTSGEIKRGLRLVTTDKRLLKFVSEKAQYLYSERVIVSDTSDLDGQTYVLNEVFSDYYKIDKQDRAWLYAYCEYLINSGRAIKK